jgi:light-regulated signal transduction histidine kinase (bacteriophytochrome)
MIDEFGRQTISRELEQSCADEAIRIIGTVQPHGFVLVAEVRTARILQVSSGIARHWPAVGEPARLLGARLSDWVDGLGGDPSGVLSALPATAPAVVSLRPRAGAASVFECVGHRMGDAAVLEWQPLGDGATQAADETRGMSEMRAAIIRLRSPKLLDPFFVACVAEVGRICGFDRIMLYKFLPDWSGEVIAEHVAHPRPLRFLGLRFPASDIPSQARALYTENKIRVLADVQAVPDTLVPAHLSGGARLDQSHCLLRGFSDVHRTYLGNMHVRATMSLSIMCDDKLWGLIACHHYEPRIASHAVRTTLRQVCELIAEVVALRIEALTQVESTHNKLLLEHLMNRLHQALSLDESMEAVLDRLLPQLLLAFEADAFYATIGEVRYAGGHGGAVAARPEIFNEVAQLIESTPAPASVLQRVDLLALGRAPLATLPAAAGILAAQQFDDVLEICAFTRPEVAREVRWAGAPVKIAGTSPQGSIRLEPRRSFALWKEQFAGTALWRTGWMSACARAASIRP